MSSEPLKIHFFSTRKYEQPFYQGFLADPHFKLVFHEEGLSQKVLAVVEDGAFVSCFVNDRVDREILAVLSQKKVKGVLLRCAGYNQVDLRAAKDLKILIARVSAYSPHAVAEHALALILTLNRKTHRAYNRIREGNFSLDGLVGFDLAQKTIGVIGTGTIGEIFCKIMVGLGCKVLAFDIKPNPSLAALGVEQVDLKTLYRRSDIISLHCPLNTNTRHLINAEAISLCKAGVMIINTGRGGLIDTSAVIAGLKSKKIGYLGLDVYEEEESLFFADHSQDVLQDDLFARLLSFQNVLITGHQGFLTQEALKNIAQTTIQNAEAIVQGQSCSNLVSIQE